VETVGSAQVHLNLKDCHGLRPYQWEAVRSGGRLRRVRTVSVLLQSEDVAWFRDDLTAARVAASRLAGRVGLGELRAGEVVLAVAEAASNLAKHAVAGSIVLRVVRTEDLAGIEFLAVDRGPGMADVAGSMRDGASTTGTLGIGLGMIARLADAFDLHSIPGRGTVMMARFWPRAAALPAVGRAASPRSVVAGLTRPISGGSACGDGWAARRDAYATPRTPPPPCTAPARSGDGVLDAPAPGGGSPVGGASGSGGALWVMLCDGVGHGPLALVAAQAAIRAFHAGPGPSPEDVMAGIHRALAGTRGAAVAVARIEPDRGRVLFCAVGNVAGAIVTPGSKTALPWGAGTAGHQLPALRATAHPLPPGSALVLHSDGLSGRWDPRDLPALLQHSPPVIAGHLMRSAGKYHDDASVLVVAGMW
jgi:anti-sigma regulatory factor (Ser/Thr protein kinase)